MKGNHLLLSDVGAEYHGYTADVTRTIPVDGVYSKEEKLIYNIVLEAQNKAIEACRVGNPFLYYQYHCNNSYFSRFARFRYN
jgi:Xaa-Pro aminopeptidase